MFTTSGNSIELAITGIKRKIESPDLIVSLGQRLSEQLQLGFAASALVPRSGASLRALEYIGEPERGLAGWSIGVGNKAALGDKSQPAPTGTLREFFTDNPMLRPTPWRRIPPDYQQKLAMMRRAGMYGGRGADYANYLWVQDQGSAAAYISERNFIDPAIERWRAEADYFIRDYFSRHA